MQMSAFPAPCRSLALVAAALLPNQEPVPVRARDLGVAIGELAPGPGNAITDVEGVAVGQATICEGEDLRTGVTLVFPRHGENVFFNRVPAAVYTGNGYGKAAGFTQVEELGEIETPIALTSTLVVGAVLDAMVQRCLAQPGMEEVLSINVVVGETNDGWLSNARAFPVRREHVEAAWEAASTGPVAEGCVGAGTGTVCFGYKGGIGTSSRRVEGWTVGVLVQTNFGGTLRIAGRPLPSTREPRREDGGSCMVVIATDAPVLARNLGRLAKRAFLGLARAGSVMSNGSGDYAIAFSTYAGNAIDPRAAGTLVFTELPNQALSPFFQAVVEATEEAVLNSLVAARTTAGRDGHAAQALDHEAVRRAVHGD